MDEQLRQPLSTQFLLRLTMALVVLLALTAGFYQENYRIWKTNHLKVLEHFGVNSYRELLEK